MLEREYSARDVTDLQQALDEQGFFVFSVKRRWIGLELLSSARELKGDRLLRFNQEILVLMRSGLPVVKVFDTLLKRQEKGWLRELLLEVKEEIKGGASLSDAMETVPGSFPYLYVAMVRAGEKTGDLLETLGRFQEYQKRVEFIKRKISAAAIYPTILMIALAVMLSVMILYVVPSFAMIYADSGTDLPAFTQLLIATSTGAIKYLPVIIPLTLLLIFFARRSLAFSTVREKRDRLITAIPLLGSLLTEYALSRFFRTLGTVVMSGTPIVDAMQMARGTLNNLYLETKMVEATQMVTEGTGFAESVASTGVMPTVAMGMIDAGETAGALDDILIEVADYYDLQVETSIEKLTQSVEPIILLLVGIVIAGVLVGMYLPIFQLAGATG